jgi:hypothetical protein
MVRALVVVLLVPAGLPAAADAALRADALSTRPEMVSIW